MLQIILIFTLFACTLGSSEKSAPLSTQKLVGGSPAYEGEFPHQVSLQMNNQHFCGGSIIDTNWVLTAAHCLKGLNAASVRVYAGKYFLSTNTNHEQIRQASKLILHSGFKERSMVNDIGLIELSRPLNLNTYVQPIALPKRGPFPGTMCIVSGWGLLYEGGYLSNVLMKLSVPVVSDNACRLRYGIYTIKNSMMCAGYQGGKNVCQGDSGGPLVCSNSLDGIVSWGYHCAVPYYPAVYTQVSSFLDWIKRNSGLE